MSNLGLYQMMTTVAKRVGGPLRFLGIVAAGGYVVLRPLETAGKWLVKNCSLANPQTILRERYFLLQLKARMNRDWHSKSEINSRFGSTIKTLY